MSVERQGPRLCGVNVKKCQAAQHGLLPSPGLVFDINDLRRIGPRYAQNRIDVLWGAPDSNQEATGLQPAP